jgi:hypothetical protein
MPLLRNPVSSVKLLQSARTCIVSEQLNLFICFSHLYIAQESGSLSSLNRFFSGDKFNRRVFVGSHFLFIYPVLVTDIISLAARESLQLLKQRVKNWLQITPLYSYFQRRCSPVDLVAGATLGVHYRELVASMPQ